MGITFFMSIVNYSYLFAFLRLVVLINRKESLNLRFQSESNRCRII